MNKISFFLTIFISLILLSPQNMSAQTLNGEYRLTGVPETASAFRFTPDGHFIPQPCACEFQRN